MANKNRLKKLEQSIQLAAIRKTFSNCLDDFYTELHKKGSDIQKSFNEMYRQNPQSEGER